MRHIMMLLTVGTLVVVTLVCGVTSAAFGRATITSGCIVQPRSPDFFLVTNAAGQIPTLSKYDHNGDNIICGYTNGFNELHFTDNSH
jgi:hypothetical protein